MTDLQINELTMMKPVRAFFAEHDVATAIAGNTALLASLTVFNNKLTQLIELTGDQAQVTTGYTTDKHTTKADLITNTIALGNAASVYFILNNDDTNTEKVEVTKSMLKNLANNECKTRCQLVYETIDTNIGVLNPDYVTTAEKTALGLILTNFETKSDDQQLAKVSTKTATEELATAYTNTLDTLHLVDKLMGKYILTKPDLLNTYLQARKVFNLGHHHSGAEGIVTSLVGNLPLENVTITETLKGTTTKTDADGNYIIDRFKPGQHTFTATLAGYQPITFTLNIKLGKHTKYDFKLTAI